MELSGSPTRSKFFTRGMTRAQCARKNKLFGPKLPRNCFVFYHHSLKAEEECRRNEIMWLSTTSCEKHYKSQHPEEYDAIVRRDGTFSKFAIKNCQMRLTFLNSVVVRPAGKPHSLWCCGTCNAPAHFK
jgi:hypothetical protein